MTSADQVARLLALVPYLQQHPDADVRVTAALFNTTPRQLVADLKVLWYCGLPGGLPGDLIEIDMDAVELHGRIRLSNAGFLARPVRFTLDEAMSLAVALRALLELGDSGLKTAVQSALVKLEAVIGTEARVGVRLAGGEDETRDALAAALARGVAVRLDYHGPSRGVATRPLVDPERIVVRDGYAYLDAWSHERGAWRSFRLDRIVAVTPTDRPVSDHGAPPSPAGGWLDHRQDAVEVTLELAPEARWVTEYHPIRSAVIKPDGVVSVTLLVADPAWLRRLLLRLGPAVLRVEPPAAAASAAEVAREALDLYES
ncbi:helix-turn-helix transcriptional regulator [Propioniciclava tarda]|uniref:WYL domain-containing protein n=1 Tax=Propioniciclava tarda TaxID=433330 RepID=A0A4Q9KLL6_PROTD|nr:WYL domain-containing protein [Propioniciclava tarda]TBT94559.1 WYL domain-containing protein [Propioniciclava tarda]SMO68499.1 proteasome accessory factor C [Propioniciclava tarda]